MSIEPQALVVVHSNRWAVGVRRKGSFVFLET